MRLATAATILAASLASTVHARAPTTADNAFCDRYTSYAQDILDGYRAGDATKIRRVQDAISRDPDQSYMVAMNVLGWNFTTPPWVADISAEARERCLYPIRGDLMGYVSGEPDRTPAGSTSENHVGSAAAMPTQASKTGPSDASTDDHLLGTFHGFNDIHFLDVPCTKAAVTLVAKDPAQGALLAWMASQPGRLMIYYNDGQPGDVACYTKTEHGISLHSKGLDKAFSIDDTRIRWIRKPNTDTN